MIVPMHHPIIKPWKKGQKERSCRTGVLFGLVALEVPVLKVGWRGLHEGTDEGSVVSGFLSGRCVLCRREKREEVGI